MISARRLSTKYPPVLRSIGDAAKDLSNRAQQPPFSENPIDATTTSSSSTGITTIPKIENKQPSPLASKSRRNPKKDLRNCRCNASG